MLKNHGLFGEMLKQYEDTGLKEGKRQQYKKVRKKLTKKR